MISKLIKRNLGATNEYVSFYVSDYHGEYPIPEMKGVTIRKAWDGFDAEEILEAAFEINDVKEVLTKVFKKLICTENPETAGEPHMIGDIEEAELSTHIRCITLWIGIDLDIIKKYIELYKERAEEAINDASGDDDYYDYMPNFVDTFRQVCEILGFPAIYNDMLRPYLTQERHEDNNFYMKEIK